MPDSIDATKPPKKNDDASLGETIEFVKTYAKQETLGPLKGAGSWLAFGVVGALALGLGLMIMMLGTLRMFQTEVGFVGDDGSTWSFAGYGFTLVVTLVLLGLTMLRIKKATLNKEPLPKKKS